jgi:predicted PurR-regulated permease PerM
MLSDRDFTTRLLQAVITVAGVAILVGLLWAAREALLIIYVSALIAMGFSPLVNVIERPRARKSGRGLPRWVAILAIYVAIVGFFILVGLMVIPPLVVQAEALWARLPEEFSRFQTLLIHYKVMTRRITLAEAVQSAPNGAGGNAVGSVLVAISGAIGGLFAIVTALILSFYLLIEAEPMFEYLIRFVPAGRRADVATVARQAVSKVSAWLRAQFVLAGAMGTFSAIGLGLMGEPYFFVVALMAAIGETIPIVGPVIGGIAAVAVAMTVSARLALMVGVYFLVLHQIEANILVPKIMERRVGVSPVAVMVALLIGGALWGLVGAILAIPTAAIISVIVEEIAVERDRPLQRVR